MATWRIEPGTLKFIEEGRPHPHGYTWDEFNAVEPPACPACGMSVNVQAAGGSTAYGGGPKRYIPGHWSCPDVSCDPSKARS